MKPFGFSTERSWRHGLVDRQPLEPKGRGSGKRRLDPRYTGSGRVVDESGNGVAGLPHLANRARKGCPTRLFAPPIGPAKGTRWRTKHVTIGSRRALFRHVGEAVGTSHQDVARASGPAGLTSGQPSAELTEWVGPTSSGRQQKKTNPNEPISPKPTCAHLPTPKLVARTWCLSRVRVRGLSLSPHAYFRSHHFQILILFIPRHLLHPTPSNLGTPPYPGIGACAPTKGNSYDNKCTNES